MQPYYSPSYHPWIGICSIMSKNICTLEGTRFLVPTYYKCIKYCIHYTILYILHMRRTAEHTIESIPLLPRQQDMNIDKWSFQGGGALVGSSPLYTVLHSKPCCLAVWPECAGYLNRYSHLQKGHTKFKPVLHLKLWSDKSVQKLQVL